MLMNNIQESTGYLALPASGLGPGILVLHAWWGYNQFKNIVLNMV
jgi:dienelactone hydrolase